MSSCYQSLHDILVDGLLHELDGSLPSRTMGAQLGNHRVIEHGDHLPLPDSCVDADCSIRRLEYLRFSVHSQRTNGRKKIPIQKK